VDRDNDCGMSPVEVEAPVTPTNECDIAPPLVVSEPEPGTWAAPWSEKDPTETENVDPVVKAWVVVAATAMSDVDGERGRLIIRGYIVSDFAAPGRIYVAASGDEGTLPNHARATYGRTAAVFDLTKTRSDPVAFQLWYSGDAPADVTLTMDDTATSVAVPPGNNCANSADGSIALCTYLPGQQFYPWTSSGPDRAVWMEIIGHSGIAVDNVGERNWHVARREKRGE